MLIGSIGDGVASCNMPAENIYLWVCGQCSRIPNPEHMERCIKLVEWLQQTPKGYPILEWGVFTGTSGMMLSIFGEGDPYKGIDWFMGLNPTAEDGDIPKINFSLTEEQVKRVRERLPGVIKAAAAPAAGILEGKFRFAHIDLDLYYPTRTALYRSWDLLIDGGRMVCDDYSWEGARKACKEFSDATGFRPAVIGNQAIWTKC